MSDPRAQVKLTELLGKWRERRERIADKGMERAGTKCGYEYAGLCEGLETCADELEAILEQLSVSPTAASALPLPMGRMKREAVSLLFKLGYEFHSHSGWIQKEKFRLSN